METDHAWEAWRHVSNAAHELEWASIHLRKLGHIKLADASAVLISQMRIWLNSDPLQRGIEDPRSGDEP